MRLFIALSLAVLLSFSFVSASIIVDHNSVANFDDIPQFWIDKAYQDFRIGYMHTSHGQQFVTGITYMDSVYDLDIPFRTDLQIQSVMNGYYPTQSAIDACTSSSAFDNPNIFLHNYFHCFGDVGSYPDWPTYSQNYILQPSRNRNVYMIGFGCELSEVCGSGVGNNLIEDIAQLHEKYLDPMQALEDANPGVQFIYMTSHMDGTGSTGRLHQLNEYIRQYVADNNKILFDYTDIARFSPDGTDYLDLGAGQQNSADFGDECTLGGDADNNWCSDYCAANSASLDCTGLRGCNHNPQGLICRLKGKGFWYLMARMAGWNGDSVCVSDVDCPSLPTTPIISSVNNNQPLTDGLTVSVVGSGFGLKSPVAPILFDQVDKRNGVEQYGGLTDTDMYSSVPYGGSNYWMFNGENDNSRNNVVFYRGEDSRITNDWMYHVPADVKEGNFVGPDNDLPADSSFYVSFWTKTDDPTVSEDMSTKIFRIWADRAADGTHTSILSWTFDEWTLHVEYDENCRSQQSGASHSISNVMTSDMNDFHHLEVQFKHLGADECGNTYENRIFRDRVPVGQTYGPFREAKSTGGSFDQVRIIGLDTGDSSGMDPVASWFDDIYIDGTLARIVLADAPLWDDISHFELQLPVSGWDDGTGNNIQFIFNQGSFNEGQQLWLYVVDENGDVSPGYEIIIGASSEPVTEPTIYGVSNDEVAEGDTITISGAGFGTQTLAQESFFEDWDWGVDEEFLDIDNSPWFVSSGNPPGSRDASRFSNDALRDGSGFNARSIRPDRLLGITNNDITWREGLDVQPGEKVYVSMYIWSTYGRAQEFGDGCPQQWKITNFLTHGIPDALAVPATGMKWEMGSNPAGGSPYTFIDHYLGTGSSGAETRVTWGAQPEEETWWQVEIEYELASDRCLEDGSLAGWYDGQFIERKVTGTWCNDEQHTNVVANGVVYDSFVLRNYIPWTPECTYTGDRTDIMRFDDIVFQKGTWARIALCDASTWDACTFREYQPVTSWDDTSISINVNKGAFSEGDIAYLYVVDEKGNASNGFPVSLSFAVPVCNNDGTCDVGEDDGNCPSDCPEDIPKVNPFDLDGDEDVDFDDLFELARTYGTITDVNDFSSDGRINILDLLILINNFT